MGEKKGVLLTVIAIATLLVAVVGATFAYFTASNSVDNQVAGTQEATAADLVGIEFNEAKLTGSENEIYPGTMNYVGVGYTAKLNSKKPNASNADFKYNVSYDVKVKVELYGAGEQVTQLTDFKFPVKWRLYKTTDPVSNPVECPDNPTAVESGSEMHYTRVCTENSEKFTEDQLVASGVIQESGDCSSDKGTNNKNQRACGNKVDFTLNETAEVSKDESKSNYYLVVEYPTVSDVDQDQSLDMGKKIKTSIDIDVTQTEYVSE